MAPTHNPVGWFEIPVSDMDRAVAFYQTVLGVTLERHMMGSLEMAWFPWVQGSMGSAGALVKHDWYTPSRDGVLVYFTAFSGDVDVELGRVEVAGGKVVVPKKKISDEYGSMAVLEDTEGNRVALHAREAATAKVSE